MAAVCMLPQQVRPSEQPSIRFLSASNVAGALNPFRLASGLQELSVATTPKQQEPTIEITDGWLCFYSFGQSIANLRKMFGCDPKCPPCFQGSIWDWWLQPKEASWVRERGAPGYKLLSLSGVCGYTSWPEQTLRIKHPLKRAQERLLCEAFFASWIMNRWSQETTEFSWPWSRYFRHWGESLTSGGERVWVALSYDGIEIGSTDCNTRTDPYLQAAVYQDL